MIAASATGGKEHRMKITVDGAALLHRPFEAVEPLLMQHLRDIAAWLIENGRLEWWDGKKTGLLSPISQHLRCTEHIWCAPMKMSERTS